MARRLIYVTGFVGNDSGRDYERGKFTLTRDRIRIIVSEGGSPLSQRIEYAGKIEDTGLRLASYSYRTHYKSKGRLFEFARWTTQVITDPRLERRCDDAPNASGAGAVK
jgi:hypothetical protein